jgi:preprotein translocase SecE subunit
MLNNFGTFISASRRELGKVQWPSQRDTARFTIFVISLSLIVAAFLGVADYGFLQALEALISPL